MNETEIQAVERLKAYREIVSAWVYGYDSHERRQKEMEVLEALLNGDIARWEECDHKTSLNTLLFLLGVARGENCHRDVKLTLRVFMTVCGNAISKPNALFRFREIKADHDSIPF